MYHTKCSHREKTSLLCTSNVFNVSSSDAIASSPPHWDTYSSICEEQGITMQCITVLLVFFLSGVVSFQPLSVTRQHSRYTKRCDVVSQPDPVPTADEEEPPPPYNPLDKALTVFGSAYFYDDEEHANRWRELREEVFGNLTVGEFFTSLDKKKGVERALYRTAGSIWCKTDP
jgi:hypothetical protein